MSAEGRELRGYGSNSVAALKIFLAWTVLFAWCGGVEYDGVRYDPSYACSPMRVTVDRIPTVVALGESK